jgi:hypothetical protein
MGRPSTIGSTSVPKTRLFLKGLENRVSAVLVKLDAEPASRTGRFGQAVPFDDCGGVVGTLRVGWCSLKHLPKLFEHHGSTGVGPFRAEADHIRGGSGAGGEERQ